MIERPKVGDRVMVPAIGKDGAIRMMTGMRHGRAADGSSWGVPDMLWVDLSPGAEGGYEWVWLEDGIYALNSYTPEELEPAGGANASTVGDGHASPPRVQGIYARGRAGHSAGDGREMTTEIRRYRCPTCGWVGTEDDMEADYCGEPAEEVWSNWICPKCNRWWQLEDYEPVNSREEAERP